MRERTKLSSKIINNLPNLKLVITSGMWNPSVDLDALNKIKSNKFSSFLRLEYNVVVEEKYFDLEKFYDYDQEIHYRVSDFDLYIIYSGYLGNNDFFPFKRKKSFFAMTAHIIFNKIDKRNTVTQSKKLIQIIRKKIGFKNILISDDLSPLEACGRYPVSLS